MRCEIICQAVHSHSLLPLSGVGEMPRDPDLAAAWKKKLSGRLAVNLSLSAAPEAILFPEMSTGSDEVREKWERGGRGWEAVLLSGQGRYKGSRTGRCE